MKPPIPSPFRITETYWRGIIIALSGAVIIFSIWCLTNGITTIFMHLYYFPIVLLAYRYRWKGFGLATLLSLAYLGLVILFDAGQLDVIIGAVYRVMVFAGIAAVIAYLSERLAIEKRSAQESSEIKERYISLAPAIILVLDRNGTVTFLNEKGGKILESTPGDVTGKSWFDHFLPEHDRDRVKRLFSKMVTGGILPDKPFENPVLTRSGTEKVIRWHNTVLHDESGEISGILGFGEDITDEKQTQDSLRKMQQFQEGVIANANVWISVIAPDGSTILVWNDAAETISGYKKSDVVGKNTIWKQLYPDKEYRRNVTGEIQRILGKDDFLQNFETEIRCADGIKKTMVWNTRALRDAQGRVIGYIAIGRDVTEQKSAELRAWESSRFLAAMIDTLPLPIFFKDARGKYLGCNPPFEEYIGIKRDELIGKTVYDISPKDLADVYTAADRKVFDNPDPQRYETQVQYADGSRHDVIFYKAPFFNKDGSSGGLIGAILDISERKKAEVALLESETKVRKKLSAILEPEGDIGTLELADIFDRQALQALMDDFFRLTGIGVAILDNAGKIFVATGWQDICTKFHRVQPGALQHCIESDLMLTQGIEPGKFKRYKCKNNLWDISTPITIAGNHAGYLFLGQFFFEDEEPDRELFRRQAQQYGFDEQEYLSALDRVPRWKRETVENVMQFYVRLINNLSTLSYNNIRLARTLAERDTLMQSLRDSERKFHTLADWTYDWEYWVDPVQQIRYMSPSVERITGYRAEEFISDPDLLNRIVHPDDRPTWELHIPLHKNDTCGDDPVETGIRITTKEGSVRWISHICREICDDKGVPIGRRVSNRDITERKRAEDELVQNRFLLSEAMDLAHLASWEFDVLTGIFTFDDRFYTMYSTTAEREGGYQMPAEVYTREFVHPDDAAAVGEEITKAIQTADPGFVNQVEHRIIRRDGQVRNIIVRHTVTKDSSGRTIKTHGANQDITDRKSAEQALRDSEEKYRAFFTTSRDCVFITTLDGSWMDFNDAAVDLFGYDSREDLLKIKVSGVYANPVERDAHIRYIRENGYSFEYPVDLQKKDGTIINTLITTVARKDAAGIIIGFQGSIRDITEQQVIRDRMQKLLHLQEEQVRIINTSPAIAFLWRAEENWPVETVSSNISSFGYSADDFVSGRVVYSSIIHPDDLGQVAAEVESNSKNHVDDFRQIYRIFGKNGSVYWIDDFTHIRRDNAGTITHYEGLILDITDRRKAEDALALEKQRMESLLSLSLMGQKPDPEIIAEVVEDAIRLTGSTIGYLATLNEDESVMTMQYWSKSAHESCKIIDKPLVYAVEKTGLWGEAVRQRKPLVTNDYAADSPYKHGTPGGHVPLVRHMNIPVFDGDHIVAIAGVGNKSEDYNEGDVRQLQLLMQGWWQVAVRKRAEEALWESREHYRAIIDYSQLAIAVLDVNHRIIMVNPRFSTLFKKPVGDFVGKYCFNEFEKRTTVCPHCPGVLAMVTRKPEETETEGVLDDGTRFSARIRAVPFFGPDGAVKGFVEMVDDITERKRAEEALRESRQLFSDIISFLPDPTFVIDKNGIVLAWNRAIEQLSGVPAGDIIGKGDHTYSLWQYGKGRPVLIDLVLNKDQDAARQNYTDIHRDGNTITAQTEITHAETGKKIPLSLVASPLIDSLGNTIGAIESMRDVSRLKETETELARINQNLEEIVRDRTKALEEEVAQRMRAEKDVHDALDYTRSVIEANPDMMAVLDKNGAILDVNVAAESLTGIPREKLIGTPYSHYLVYDETNAAAFLRLLDTGKIEQLIKIQRVDGTVTPLSLNATVIATDEGTEPRIIIAAHDITRQKQDEEAIRASLEEKVLLLREVHHRVNNNLQIIISLTSLQIRQTRDPAVKQIMSETQNRVRAMSLVHEKLYRSQSLSHIDFADYTRYLATQLFSFYGIDTRRVRLEFTLGKIMVDIVTAVPLGLLMNELISNALKHAFPDGREGTISISSGEEGNLITLVVRDNGIGIPEDLDWKNAATLGMRLINSLVDQVDGTITLDRENGTAFIITVKRDTSAGGAA
jgi:PAS domain S-box-containing protein